MVHLPGHTRCINWTRRYLGTGYRLLQLGPPKVSQSTLIPMPATRLGQIARKPETTTAEINSFRTYGTCLPLGLSQFSYMFPNKHMTWTVKTCAFSKHSPSFFATESIQHILAYLNIICNMVKLASKKVGHPPSSTISMAFQKDPKTSAAGSVENCGICWDLSSESMDSWIDVWIYQWIGLLGKIWTGNPWFLANLGLSCRFSHHPILWIYEHHTSMFRCLNVLVKYLIYALRRGGITFEGEMMNNFGWYPTVVLGGHHCHPISQNSSTLGTLDG